MGEMKHPMMPPVAAAYAPPLPSPSLCLLAIVIVVVVVRRRLAPCNLRDQDRRRRGGKSFEPYSVCEAVYRCIGDCR